MLIKKYGEMIYKLTINDNCFAGELLCQLKNRDKGTTHPEILTVNGNRSGRLCADKCKVLIRGPTLLRDMTSEYMQEVIVILNKPNTDQYANWRFKYFLAMCAFEGAGIERVTRDNKLVRTRLTTREMAFMIFCVQKSHVREEWLLLKRIMPYLEWEVLEMIMDLLSFNIGEREELNEHLEMIDDYLEKCVRKTFEGLMTEYGGDV